MNFTSFSTLRLDGISLLGRPFSHAVILDCLETGPAERLLRWFETSAPWQLSETNFYEQYEFSLFDCQSEEARLLTDGAATLALRESMGRMFETQFQPEVSIVAHKLLPGQHIGIHNDYLEDGETHRLTIQLNRGLQDTDGGFFMTFSSGNPRDVCDVYRPIHRSAVAFAISPSSFHAVSRMQANERYTVVFSLTACNR